MRYIQLIIYFWVLFIAFIPAYSNTFVLKEHSDMVGSIQTAIVKKGDTLAQIARNYDMGYTELQEANPGIDVDHLVTGTVLVIPSQFILPDVPREGLVVNLAEMRLYFYPKNENSVITHPLGVGRDGEDTILGKLSVIEHIRHPTWTATDTMRKLRAQEGVILPKSVPPGPDNPMGDYAMRLSSYTYLIHGTNDPLGGIGRRSSSGCMRLYPEDIESLYRQVKNGTTVKIINTPYKVGWVDRELFIQSHAALDTTSQEMNMAQIKNVIKDAINQHFVQVDWDKAIQIAKETQGIPQSIGKKDFI